MGRPSKAVTDFMEKYAIASDEIWEVHGTTWVVKHKALERVAAEQGVIWERPELKVCDMEKGMVVVLISGKLNERVEYSFGEASPKNNKNSYPIAMAEKRAKDRVILKLLAAHGDLYSEEEADDFKQSARPEKRGELPKKDAKPVYTKLQAEIQSATTRESLKEWGVANKDRISVLPEDWQDILRLQFEEQMADLRQREAV